MRHFPMAARRLPENASPTARIMLALVGWDTMTVTMATVTIAEPILRTLSRFTDAPFYAEYADLLAPDFLPGFVALLIASHAGFP